MRVSVIHPGRALFLAMAIVFLASVPSSAEGPPGAQPGPDNAITVVATRKIQGGNIALAKQEAVEAALSAAVDQAALTLLSSEAIARAFQSYSAAVAGKAEKYIDSYKILGEASSGGTYRVMLQAVVSTGQLKAGLSGFRPTAPPDDSAPTAADTEPATGGAEPAIADVDQAAAGSVQAVDRPRLLLLLSEQNLNDVSPRFWWGENPGTLAAHAEAAIARKAEAAGFVVIEHGTGTPDVPVKAAIIFQPELNNRDAADIGRLLGADVAIVGKAIAYAIGDTGAGGDPAYNATITMKAVLVQNGQEITSGFETAVRQGRNDTEGGREALTAAGIQAAGHLIPSIGAAWENAVRPSESITLTVSGTGNLGNFVRFRQTLRDLDGVMDLQVREMNADAAIIAVRFEGNSQDLKERLLANTFELFAIEVLSLSNKRLDIALVPK
ncbi:hypothetical protein [Desulfococcus sp.]|uniref:hypothetical protein n=1 Tax=Desulfococcus sp. TaxID=2025834 RepID=UPI003593D4E1